MTKTVFANGSKVYAAWTNAIQNLKFVANPENDGEYPLITDSDLSNAAGQIKPQWQAFRDALAVTAGVGLSVQWQGGSVFLLNNTLVTIAPGSNAVTANSTVFAFVDSTGSVAIASSLPLNCLPLAQVVAGTATITTVTDLRPRYRILPRPNATKVFGGSGGQLDYSLASGSATLDRGVYYFRNFTIASGATLNVSRFARIFCSGNVTINGAINVSTATQGGTGYGLNIAIASFAASIPGQGFGSGAFGAPTGTYNWQLSPVGSGGGAGSFYNTAAVSAIGTVPSGGPGGGGVIFEVAGAITVAAGATIMARGANATSAVVTTGTNLAITGAGGGSGGLIALLSLQSVTVQGTLDVNGGNGGAAAGTGGTGGGGGGGGTIVMISPNNTYGTATLNMSGGSAGASISTQTFGGSGGSFGGSGGTAAANPATAGTSGLLIADTYIPVG